MIPRELLITVIMSTTLIRIIAYAHAYLAHDVVRRCVRIGTLLSGSPPWPRRSRGVGR